MKLTKEEENNISINASCEETMFGFDLATMTNPSCGHRLACMRAPHEHTSTHVKDMHTAYTYPYVYVIMCV